MNIYAESLGGKRCFGMGVIFRDHNNAPVLKNTVQGRVFFSPLPQKLNNTKLVNPPPAAYLESLYLPCFKITEHRVFAYL
jgi:hypothetical protein